MIRTALLCFAAVALFAGASSQSVADQPFEETETSTDEQWREQLLTAHREVIQARKRHEDARVAYQRMRNQHRMRGEPKRLVVEELELAEAALPKAEQELESLSEAARRAGVPPGSMRFYAADLVPAAND